MTDILFHILLPIGLCGSLFYALLRAARPLLVRLGPRAARGLLLVCAALFVLPLPLLGAALASLQAPSVSVAGGETILLAAPLARPAVQAGRALGAALQVSSAAGAGGAAGHSLLPLLGWIYLAGALAALALTLYRWQRLTRRLHAASRPVTDPAVLAQYAAVCAALRVGRPPRLYQSDAAAAPLLAGWRHARIILPGACPQPRELEYAFRHELAHHQSADLPCKYLLALLCALHWYNPLAHLLKHDFSAACEESCDARVTETMHPARRKAYAQTLLRFTAPTPAGPVSAFGGPARRLRGRLEKLLRPVRPGRALRAAGLGASALMLGAALLAGCGLAAGASSPPQGQLAEASFSAPSSAPGMSSSFPPAGLASLPDLMGKTLAEAEAELTRLGIPYRVVTIENTRGEAYENTIASVTLPASGLVPGSGATPAEVAELVVYRSSGTVSGVVLPVSEAGFVCPVPEVKHYARGFDNVHRGLDFNAPAGTPVYAAAAGRVLYAGFHYAWGYYVVLAHEGGLRTRYAHCEQLLTATDDAVTQGQQIATVGNTGNSTGTHLHLEITEGAGETLEEAGTLLDPADYLILPDVPFGTPA